MPAAKSMQAKKKGIGSIMLHLLLPAGMQGMIAFIGIMAAFAITIAATKAFAPFLPKDGGREFAHDGKLSAGKPRGAGIVFVIAFAVIGLLFGTSSAENTIYLILILISMMTGFLDDASKTPWGEYKKGFLDLCVALLVACTYVKFNGCDVKLALFGVSFSLPIAVFVILAAVLVWASVNVTNCSDGVDGLSGTISIITMMTFYVVDGMLDVAGDFKYLVLVFAVCILGYLWFNATPSRLMMGDAGSRAMGLFIAICALKSGSPFLFIPIALVLILDGGLGLLKVFLLRFLKIHILKNVRTPLHDQVRKVWQWSNTQCVTRFAIIQIVISMAVVYGISLMN